MEHYGAKLNLTYPAAKYGPATVELEVDAVGGVLLGFDMESDAHFNFVVAGEAASSPRRVPMTFGVDTCTPDAGSIAPGKVVFEVHNTTADRRAVLGALQLPPSMPPRGMLRFTPFLSGKRLLMTQTFRDFFRSDHRRSCGSRHHGAVHRSQRLDGSLRADRRP